jgi:hypothetical protein
LSAVGIRVVLFIRLEKVKVADFLARLEAVREEWHDLVASNRWSDNQRKEYHKHNEVQDSETDDTTAA